MNKAQVLIEVSEQEHAAILTGLRLYQRWYDDDSAVSKEDDAIMEIATNGGAFAPLVPDEIDDVCERINISVARKGKASINSVQAGRRRRR